MDDSQTQSYETRYQLALDSTPEEVRDFLWSDAYTGLIRGIANTCALTAEQEKIVSDLVFDIVIGMSDEADAQIRLTEAHIAPETQQTIFSLAYDYIVEPSAQEVQNTVEEKAIADQASALVTGTSTVAPSPSDVLANLGARLKTNSVIVPNKKTESTNPSASAPSASTIDPYREIPEK